MHPLASASASEPCDRTSAEDSLKQPLSSNPKAMSCSLFITAALQHPLFSQRLHGLPAASHRALAASNRTSSVQSSNAATRASLTPG